MIPATEWEEGYTKHACSRCGYSYIDGSPFLTSNSSRPGNSAADWGSCGGKYDLFYCIDFYAHGNANGATTKPGTTIEQTPAWQKLSHQAQKGIQLALIYGVPNCSSYYDNVYG